MLNRLLRDVTNTIAVALFLCLAMGFGVVVHSSNEAQKAAQTDRRTAAHQDASGNYQPSFYSVIGLVFSDKFKDYTAYCNSYREDQRKKWPQGYYCDFRITDFYLAVFTGLLFFATSALGYYAFRSFWDSRVLQRAYVSVAPGGIRPYLSLDGRLSCDVWFRNAGHLPAKNVSWFIERKFSDDAEDRNFKIPQDERQFGGNNLIPPQSRIRKGGPAIMHTDLDQFIDANRFKPDKAWLYVWGRVRYRDGFKRRLRFTDFCFRYNLNLPKSTWTIEATHGRQHEHGNRTDEG